MSILIGKFNLHKHKKSEVTIYGVCPHCKGDLVPYEIQEWFVLFFLPIIPIKTWDSYYRCKGCKSVFGIDFKTKLLCETQRNDTALKYENRSYARALIASMTHMANIDGEYSPTEYQVINDMIKLDFKERDQELKSIEKFVLEYGNLDNYVFDLLGKVKNELSQEGLIELLSKSVTVLLADGRIDPKEKNLLTAYLKHCKLPSRFSKIIIQRGRAL